MQGFLPLEGNGDTYPIYMFNNTFGVRMMLYGVPIFQPQRFNLVSSQLLKFLGGYSSHDTIYY
jgi:hypothetical protein